ncbi:hypothetical protein HPB49_015921 [Dermacentor silvarum]|uniref:Uncharacterized protein n=1 Tax=Dermacentor silvarum TaxID=543639 RepID=A0ACB8DEI1_DERSI|nr:hypothetical protein HPB49_015921 [Dermacentor silvarum]
MIPGNESRNQFPSSEPTHWVSKAPAGSEDVITLTKAQLQKLLRALEAQEPSDTIATASVPTITSALNKLPISGDDCLPNWVKRNSTALRSTQHSNESSLAGFPQRLSNSHPELGTGSSRPFSKLAQKQRQWEKEKGSESTSDHSSVFHRCLSITSTFSTNSAALATKWRRGCPPTFGVNCHSG